MVLLSFSCDHAARDFRIVSLTLFFEELYLVKISIFEGLQQLRMAISPAILNVTGRNLVIVFNHTYSKCVQIIGPRIPAIRAW
jgi:hypothetical protein